MSPSPNGCPDPTDGAPSQAAAFEALVGAMIDRHGLIRRGEGVVVAVSGGPDSVALLHALHALQPRYASALTIAHLHHGLRQHADTEQAFVAALARDLGLPFVTERRDVVAFQRRHGLSPEDAARRVRYRFLGAVADASRCSRIAVGHQADDTAELVLMNLLRGSGPLGLAGISPRQGRVIRPFVDIAREQILAYLAVRQLTFCRDESNADTRFTRNRIRQELMPHLERHYNPRLRQTLQRTARILRDEEVWIEELVGQAWQHLRATVLDLGLQIDRAALLASPPALQRRLLRRALIGVVPDLKRFAFTHIEQVRQLAATGGDFPKHLDLPRGVRVTVDTDRLSIMTESAATRRARRHGDGPAGAVPYLYAIDRPTAAPFSTEIPEIAARLRWRTAARGSRWQPQHPQQAVFDLDRLAFPLQLRPIQPGDRLQPLGMTGSKKVSALLADSKIPRALRQRIPVLLSGDRIVWVVGVRTARHARVRADTGRLLIGEFCLLK